MKSGAVDYIAKPIDLAELLLLVERACERRTLVRNKILRQRLREKAITHEQIIFKSAKMGQVINLVGRIADSKASVLIQGES